MSPSKSEDGSAAIGQMVMRSFTSFLSYVLLPPKKKSSVFVFLYVLHHMYLDVLRLNCVAVA